MSSNELDLFDNADTSPGAASDTRGMGQSGRYTEAAKALLVDHPIGTELSPSLMDQRLQKLGLLAIPAEGTPKNSDAWLGHLQRRHIMIGRINKSSTHPRMREQGSECFVIVPEAGLFRIKAPQEVIAEGKLPKKTRSVFINGRKHLRYLMESADWTVLPPHEKAMAESIDDDYDIVEAQLTLLMRGLEKKFEKLRFKIKLALSTGNIQPRDDGIHRFLAAPDEKENGAN